MIDVSRTDTSVVGRWWWTVDRWTLLALALLIATGGVLTLAASPPVAERLGLDQFHFFRRQLTYLGPALALMFAVSLLPLVWVRRVAAVGFAVALGLTLLTLVVGPEVKGATRWLYLGGLSVQPSEFLKPTFAVVAAWMFAEARRNEGFPGTWISTALLALVIVLLLAQPDVGMALVVAAVWCGQFFIAGMPIALVAGFVALSLIGTGVSYWALPHVAERIDRFLDPSAGNYQVERAMAAFRSGGLVGRGPGEGAVKTTLPDAHTDFIFAVAGEEFGLLLCLGIIVLFAFVVLRGLVRLLTEDNLFVVLAAAGLITQFGLQAVINIGVNLHLMPTKGMTLPFISYGGSSLVALAFGMGLFLSLTRRRVGPGEGS